MALLATTALVVLRTFSKIAGLAGLRVGYAVARETIDRLNRVRAPYNVNRLGRRRPSPPSTTARTRGARARWCSRSAPS